MDNIPRPTKCRRVEFFPRVTYFSPMENRESNKEEILLKIEELEAMRLKDIHKLSQEECAKSMKVSRQTFQNIIDSARNKVALALTEGKAINIKGGHYITSHCEVICKKCNKDYEIQYEYNKSKCPSCGSEQVACSKKEICKKWCKKDNIEED